MEKSMEDDGLKEKRFKVSCCRSYLTPKGRCYTCPELDDELKHESEYVGELEEVELQKDPDEEHW